MESYNRKEKANIEREANSMPDKNKDSKHEVKSWLERLSVPFFKSKDKDSISLAFESYEKELNTIIQNFREEVIPYMENNAVYNDCVKVKDYVGNLEKLSSSLPEMSKSLSKLYKYEPAKASENQKQLFDNIDSTILGLKDTFKNSRFAPESKI